MNEYGFDYLNYITSIPKGMDYGSTKQSYINPKEKSYQSSSEKSYMTPINKKYTSQSYQSYSNKSEKSYEELMKKSNMSNMMEKYKDTNMMDYNQTLDPTEGWLRGNLFPSLYEPYKNYKPMELNPTNERETLLYQVMQYKFALTELNLYLDAHPNDKEILDLYNKYLTIEKQMTDKYESMYGPLSLDSNYLGKNTWKWNNSPWPWEGV